jgi:hypothetical protein
MQVKYTKMKALANIYKNLGGYKNISASKNLGGYKNIGASKNLGGYKNIGACLYLGAWKKLGARQCWRSRKSRWRR